MKPKLWFEQFISNLANPVGHGDADRWCRPISIGEGEYEGHPNPQRMMGFGKMQLIYCRQYCRCFGPA